MELTVPQFEAWLRRYGAAWEGKDARAASELFTPQAQYYWTPFDPPQRGRAEIAAAWQGAVDRQNEIRFEFEILSVNGDTGIARWRCGFDTVPEGGHTRLDGIFVTQFESPTQCRIFREWWHAATDR